MSELQNWIEHACKVAKAGAWERLLAEWDSSTILAKRCSRYISKDSRWTFLHQAAYFGNEIACRELIKNGAAVEALTYDNYAPADIAEKQGYSRLADFLKQASMGGETLWAPPVDPDLSPSSNRWHEAMQLKSHTQLLVAYGGGLVVIPQDTIYFVDSFGRILIGWHGTFNPPCGMDGEPII